MNRAAVRALVTTFVAALALASIGCPKPEDVGHAPKEQIDMAKERLDKASDKAAAGLNEAAKAADTQ
ncbi:MAG: hypothetical protein IT383_09115 [Deltaproteobacteria bacterium]|nr:hypothetical protein [Deltaproteobacteria bacterium]